MQADRFETKKQRNPSNANGCSDHDGWTADFWGLTGQRDRKSRNLAFDQERRNGVMEETKKQGVVVNINRRNVDLR